MNKTKWILLGIEVVTVVAIIAFYKLAPFWVSMVSLGSFAFGAVSMHYLRKWYDENHLISQESITGTLLEEKPEWGSLNGYVPADPIEEIQPSCMVDKKEK